MPVTINLKKDFSLLEVSNVIRSALALDERIARHKRPEISEEYQKLMEEYRQKAIRICIKIDNLKNKNNK